MLIYCNLRYVKPFSLRDPHVVKLLDDVILDNRDILFALSWTESIQLNDFIAVLNAYIHSIMSSLLSAQKLNAGFFRFFCVSCARTKNVWIVGAAGWLPSIPSITKQPLPSIGTSPIGSGSYELTNTKKTLGKVLNLVKISIKEKKPPRAHLLLTFIIEQYKYKFTHVLPYINFYIHTFLPMHVFVGINIPVNMYIFHTYTHRDILIHANSKGTNKKL